MDACFPGQAPGGRMGRCTRMTACSSRNILTRPCLPFYFHTRKRGSEMLMILPTAGWPPGAGLNETVTRMAISPDPRCPVGPCSPRAQAGVPIICGPSPPHRLILLGPPIRLPRHPHPASLWSFQPRGHLSAWPGLTTWHNVAVPASVRHVYVVLFSE